MDTLHIAKQDITRSTIVQRPAPVLAAGDVLLRTEQFALTANNVTYAAFGEEMAYWQFFPTGEPAMGQVPVWGAATVEASNCDAIAEGERLYGYLPAASHVIVQPGKVRPEQFTDLAAHRQPLPAVYNNYTRLAHDPMHDPRREAERALFGPLFLTSWLLDDFLADNHMFGARQIVLSSASSKTAIGLAWCLSQRQNIAVVGLTSAANKGFVAGLGVYSQVLTYDEISDALPLEDAVFVDMAGNAAVRFAVHAHLSAQLQYSCAVGGAHWDQQLDPTASSTTLPGVKPIFFFAPAQMQKRADDWGMADVLRRYGATWLSFVDWVAGWHRVAHLTGAAAVKARYDALIRGEVDPAVGTVASF